MNNDMKSRSTHTGSGEADLLHYFQVIKSYWKNIMITVLMASIGVVIATLLMTNIFKAEATIIPVSEKSGGGGLSGMLSQFGGLASMAGLVLPGGAEDAEKFKAILKSRTLTEKVIHRENLMPILFEKSWDAAAGTWKNGEEGEHPTLEDAVTSLRSSHMKFGVNKNNNTIKISAEFKNPKRAAKVANAYLYELQDFINSNAFTMAKRNRIFLENRLAGNKRELLEAGKEINEFYKKNDISNVDALVDVEVDSPVLDPLSRSVFGLGVQDTSRVAGLHTKVGDGISLDGAAAVEALISQKAEIDMKLAGAEQIKDVPQQVYLTYLMMRRELLARVNTLLTTQFEMARIEESKEDLAFQVIDWAVPPAHKFKPKRALICMGVFFASLFSAIFLAFLRDYFKQLRRV